MSELNKESAVQETALPEESLALDPMNPDPEMAMPDHAPGAILADMAGDALERGKEGASRLAAPAGLALATASCGADDIARLSQRPGEGFWAYLFRLILENPKSATATFLSIGFLLFGIRNTLKAVGSAIADTAKATGRFLIAANERGPQKPITPGNLQSILAGFDENNATPALSMMQPADRQRIVELDRGLRQFFATLRFSDEVSGTALYENIVRLAYAHGLLQEIGDGTFAMPGAPAAAPVPAGPHRAPRAAYPAAPVAGGKTLTQRRVDLLAQYEGLWQALGRDNLTVTAAEGFDTNLQALITTVGTAYRLTPGEQTDLRQAITTFLNGAPYYRPNVDQSGELTDHHRRLLTGELKRSVVTPPRTRAATVLGRFPAGAPGAAASMADQVNHGRAETVDRVATVIDGNVPRRRRVRDTIIRGAMFPRGTKRGYVGDFSARSFGLGGNAWALWQLAGMAVGAGEPVPVRPPVVDPPAIHGLPSPEAAGADSAAEGGKNASSTDAGLKASQDATEMANKKIELKQVVDMFKSGKNELGDDMSPADRERLTKALQDLEKDLIKLKVPQKDIDKIKGTPAPSRSGDAAVEKSGTLDTAVQPDAGVAPDAAEAAPDAEAKTPTDDDKDSSEPTRAPGAPLIFE